MTFKSPGLTFFCRFSIIILIGIYLWASVALGAKCSNLTNRGIVARGPYAFVRHPAYISKCLAWSIATLPYLSIINVAGAFFWVFIYYLRAITEERHLGKDPEYRDYCKKVKWKFVPYLW